MASNESTSKSEYLSDEERELVFFIEKFHAMSGVPPEELSMIDFLKSLGYNVTQARITEMLSNPLFIKSMDARGIVLNSTYKSGHLTPRQMAAAAHMMNYLDRRSDEKKLRDIGVNPVEWSTWMQDEVFVNYLQGRAERLLSNTTHEAHLGLIRGVRSGNVQAIKLHYEITDRYNPAKDEAVNIRFLIARVIEVIQKHVKDPEILGLLGRDLNQVAIEAMPSPVANNNVIRGSAVERR